MSHFQHLTCFLYSIVEQKILLCEISKSLHSILIYILHSIPTFLELGTYQRTIHSKQMRKIVMHHKCMCIIIMHYKYIPLMAVTELF